MKPVRRLARANEDVEEVAAYFESEAPHLLVQYADELQQAIDHISRQPGTGSPRYAHALNLPGLRFWPLRRLPYFVFYVEGADEIRVQRVLHARRDLPVWLTGEQ